MAPYTLHATCASAQKRRHAALQNTLERSIAKAGGPCVLYVRPHKSAGTPPCKSHSEQASHMQGPTYLVLDLYIPCMQDPSHINLVHATLYIYLVCQHQALGLRAPRVAQPQRQQQQRGGNQPQLRPRRLLRGSQQAERGQRARAGRATRTVGSTRVGPAAAWQQPAGSNAPLDRLASLAMGSASSPICSTPATLRNHF